MPTAPPFRLSHLRLHDGLQFEYAEQGPRGGPTVLMLHGITDSWRSFEPVLPLLPAHWHVVALSQRGHGGSDKTPRRYRTEDFAADAAAFARALDLAPMIVVGHSMGAANALRLALDAPELVQGLVLAGAFARFSGEGRCATSTARRSRRWSTRCRRPWLVRSSSTRWCSRSRPA
jgi:non-heme chloroperoxidase